MREFTYTLRDLSPVFPLIDTEATPFGAGPEFGWN